MKEWSANKTLPLEFLAVCSDSSVGREDRRRLTELFAPVTTDPNHLTIALKKPIAKRTTRAVFCTYQSSPMVAESIKSIPGFMFDLAFFDEAHRTTGINKTEGSLFQTGLSNDQIPCRKRLFMTATPRVFTEHQKSRIENKHYDGQSYSMDDEGVFGPVFYKLSFAEAVDGKRIDSKTSEKINLRTDGRPVLSDYQIHVVAASRGFRWQAAHSDHIGMEWADIPGYEPQGKKNPETGEREPALSLSDGVRLAGAWDALSTPYSEKVDPHRPAGKTDIKLGWPTRTALLYANKIPRSREVAMVWAELASRQSAIDEEPNRYLQLKVNHVDGNTPAAERTKRISRLRTVTNAPPTTDEDAESPICEILTNVKVLTEGVDVPGLDAVIFLDPKTSEVDITQAVGRAMRTTDHKTKGHIVIPVVIDEQEEDPNRKLAQSEFANVANVVRALRSHDDRVDYWVSDPDICQLKGKFNVRVIGNGKKTKRTQREVEQLRFQLTQQLASVIVDKVGDKKMWPRWGQQAAKVCADVRSRLKSSLTDPVCQQAFEELVYELGKVMGGQVDPDSTEEMVAQHIVTIPVFDAMFHGHFAQVNPISRRIDTLRKTLEMQGINFQGDCAPLQRAYDRMKEVFDAAGDADKKVDVLREIYDGFFKEAMPNAIKQLGIVYTPIQIVDFIIKSAAAICEKEFGVHISDQYVQFYDPFCGTGTFPTRLLDAFGRDGKPIVPDNALENVWKNMHGSEIVMLAYYVSALQVEETYRKRINRRDEQDPDYQPWEGLVLQNTFLSGNLGGGRGQQRELDDAEGNVGRAARLDQTPVDIIFSNPPWGSGANRTGQVGKLQFPKVAERVRETYNKSHKALGLKLGGNAAGNLFVQAIRWATDQLDKEPANRGKMIGFVHPNSLTDATSLAGMRASLRDEFTDIYVVNLRGNAKKAGEEWQKEGDKVFGAGAMLGTQITFLVRNPRKDLKEPAILRYAQVPDYLKLNQKWDWLEFLGDITSDQLKEVPVTSKHDWVNLSDGTYEKMVPICTVGANQEPAVSQKSALGIATACDFMAYSYNRQALEDKIRDLLDEYDAYLLKVRNHTHPTKQWIEKLVEDSLYLRSIARIQDSLRRGRKIVFDPARIRQVLYRPFTKLWLYEDDRILSSARSTSRLFPHSEITEAVSFTSGSGRGTVDTPIAHDVQPDLNSVRGGGGKGRHAKVILISNGNNMIFQALAAAWLTDLAAIKGSQQTRVIPR